MGDNIFSLPWGGNYNFTAVRTYMVILCRHFGRVVLELVTPGIAYVHINRITVSVQLPYGGNLQVIPAFVVEAGFPEISRTGVCILYPVELPGSVQSHVVSWLFFVCFLSCICILKSKVVRVHRRTVYRIYFRIAPFLEGLRTCCKGEDCEQTCHKLFLHAIILLVLCKYSEKL